MNNKVRAAATFVSSLLDFGSIKSVPKIIKALNITMSPQLIPHSSPLFFIPLFSLLFLLLLLLYSPSVSATVPVPSHPRRILHHPLILSTPLPSSVPPSEPPFPSPFHLPIHHSISNLPFSSSSSSSSSPPPSESDNVGLPFFPTNSPPPLSPPPPQPPVSDIPTFPANVSSLAIPTPSATRSRSHAGSYKLVILSVSSIVIFLSLVVIALIIRRKNNKNSSELRPLYPNDTPTSDGGPPPKLPNNTHVSHTSSEFLYLGTVSETSEFQVRPTVPIEGTTSSLPEVEERVYHLKLCGNASPELKPLPPLPKHSGSFHFRSSEHEGGVSDTTRGERYEEFFSPSNSSRHDYAGGEEDDFFNNSGLKSCFSSSCRGSPGKNSPGSDSDVSIEIQVLAEKAEFIPAPPPPPPSQRTHVVGVGPPPLIPPSGEVVMKRSGNLRKSGERNEEVGGGGGGSGGGMKPKLKALYWDKVRASSDRLTVWDQLHPGSFKVNEEMIETLFTANGGAKDGARRSILPSEEYRVLDPKKSQNIAILLKALSVTEKEVCEALLEGNADALGTELLESLLKMAPTKEEERKLLDYNDETPMKLGPAEKFLRAVVDVPFAFKRVDAMLYMTAFDCEIEYLRKAFETLEAACEQLRNSRMFLKLLEAVLKTGNRMNVGTNRGDALAFKLDTLLKLIDIKGRDGKTTLLHFVVQEIIKAEGTRNSQTDPDPKPVLHIQPDDIESRKRGLEVVSSLGGELMNVKKAAAMDSDALSKDVAKLARDSTKINEILKLNEENQITETKKTFVDSMNVFLKKAEVEIVRIQYQESNAFAKVKELTEYFHGNLSKEEAHPFRIFTVVNDFLSVLEQVCKEVGKINERTIMNAARQFPTSVNPPLQSPFPEFGAADGDSSTESVIKA